MIRTRLSSSYAASAIFCLAAIWAANAAAEELGPFVVGEQGEFYEGGVYEDASGAIVTPPYPSTGDAVAMGLNHMAGQMYVFYQIPAGEEGWHWQRSGRYPIIMIHGSQQTGANYLGTPDQRPGWAAFYVMHGWPVYVIDQPGRGKSGYFPWVSSGPPPLVGAQDYGMQAGNPSPLSVEENFTAPELTVPLAWPQAALHTQWPGGHGSGVPGQYAFDQFFASQVANMPNGNQALALTTAAVTALIKKIGPAIIITHSMSGPLSWLIPQANPGMIKAILAVEPTGNSSLAGNTAPGTNCGLSNGGPSFVPDLCLDFTPPISGPADLALTNTPQPAGGIEGVAERHLEVLVLGVLARLVGHGDLLAGHGEVDPHRIEVAVLVVLARRLDHHPAARDPIEDIVQPFRLGADLRIDLLGWPEVVKRDLYGESHGVHSYSKGMGEAIVSTIPGL